MPDFDRPVTAADDAAEHLRALMHATRQFNDPSDTYWVTADLLAMTRRLQGALINVASAHMNAQSLAQTDDGNHLAGRNHVHDAAAALRKAALLLEDAQGLIDRAQGASGRIAWREPATREDHARREARVVPLGGKRPHASPPGRAL